MASLSGHRDQTFHNWIFLHSLRESPSAERKEKKMLAVRKQRGERRERESERQRLRAICSVRGVFLSFRPSSLARSLLDRANERALSLLDFASSFGTTEKKVLRKTRTARPSPKFCRVSGPRARRPKPERGRGLRSCQPGVKTLPFAVHVHHRSLIERGRCEWEGGKKCSSGQLSDGMSDPLESDVAVLTIL